MNTFKIHIIGGTGKMGSWLKNFFESQNIHVSISGRKSTNQTEIKNADIIFFSVPISRTADVIQQTTQINSHALFVDLSSVKQTTQKVLETISNSSISIHMLFGPTVTSLQNQKIIVIQKKISQADRGKVDFLIQLFRDNGAYIVYLEANTHDTKMAYIQSLIHFSNLALAKTLFEAGIAPAHELSTPVFLTQVSVIERILSQSPQLLSEIQIENPEFGKIREEYEKNISLFSDIILNRDIDTLNEEIESLKHYITPKPAEKNKSIKTVVSQIKLPHEELRVGYLGPQGTFSHQATQIVSDQKLHTLIPMKTIYDVFEAVSEGKLDYGVVPAENTTEGTVRETLDFLIDFDLRVNGSITLAIHQNLLSAASDIAQIKKVISHPQATAQTRAWRNKHMPEVVVKHSDSTVSALATLGKDPTIGFISPALASQIYNVPILASSIEDNPENVTKFYIIAKSLTQVSLYTTKTLLFLTIFNRVGILRDILTVFANFNINLNKIESRPSREKAWDYHFFVEIELSAYDEKLTQCLNLLRQYCPVITVLGGV